MNPYLFLHLQIYKFFLTFPPYILKIHLVFNFVLTYFEHFALIRFIFVEISHNLVFFHFLSGEEDSECDGFEEIPLSIFSLNYLKLHICFFTMGKFIQDFKEFALKGNVIDMAIGVIIGGAFGKIVTSLVNDIIMPVVSLATGSMKFSDLSTVLRPEVKDAAGVVVQEAVTFNYGMFIQNIVDFLIIALCIFMALRYTMKFMKKEEKVEEAPAPAPEPTKEEVLLTEIRDLLAKKN